MLYREIIAVCSQNHTKHINTLCGQNVEFCNVKLAVHFHSCKWYQWIAAVHSKCSKIPPSTSMQSSTLLATVRVALLRSSWRSCFMRAALFIMRATSSSLVFTFSLYTSLFIHPHRQKSDLYAPTSNGCIFTPTENWTHVYMNLFTWNSPYYDLLKY